MDTNDPHALFLEQYSGDAQKPHSGQFKKQQFTGDLFPRLLFRRVCTQYHRSVAVRRPEQGQGIVGPVAVNVFRSLIEYHSHFSGAGVQPHAVGIGEQGGVHILHGGNGLNHR